MKIGIVGVGAVGTACALASIMRGAAREIVLLNRTRKRAEAVATDMRYGTPLSPVTEIRDGDYEDLAGAAADHDHGRRQREVRRCHRPQRSGRAAQAPQRERQSL